MFDVKNVWFLLVCFFFIFQCVLFQNYMIPLKQVLNPQEMEAIFDNLEASKVYVPLS